MEQVKLRRHAMLRGAYWCLRRRRRELDDLGHTWCRAREETWEGLGKAARVQKPAGKPTGSLGEMVERGKQKDREMDEYQRDVEAQRLAGKAVKNKRKARRRQGRVDKVQSDADRVREMGRHNNDVLRRECRGRWSRVTERHWNDEDVEDREAAAGDVVEGLELVGGSGRHLRCRVTLEAALQQAKRWSQQWEKWCEE